MPRPKPGEPPLWINPTAPIRLPKVFHPILTTTAKLLDSGSIDPSILLGQITQTTIAPRGNPSLGELTTQIEGLVKAIALAKGWDMTAAEVGTLVSTLEQAVKEVDQVFAEKAKIEAMAIATKKKSKK